METKWPSRSAVCSGGALACFWASGFIPVHPSPDTCSNTLSLIEPLIVPAILLVLALMIFGSRSHSALRVPQTLAIGCLVLAAICLMLSSTPIGIALLVVDAALFSLTLVVVFQLVTQFPRTQGALVTVWAFLIGGGFIWAYGSLVSGIDYNVRVALLMLANVLALVGAQGQPALLQQNTLKPVIKSVAQNPSALLGTIVFAFIFGFLSPQKQESFINPHAVNLMVAAIVFIAYRFAKISFDIDFVTLGLLPLFAASLLAIGYQVVPFGLNATLVLQAGYVFYWEALVLQSFKNRWPNRQIQWGALVFSVVLLFLFTRLGRLTFEIFSFGEPLDDTVLSGVALILVWMLALVGSLVGLLQRRRTIQKELHEADSQVETDTSNSSTAFSAEATEDAATQEPIDNKQKTDPFRERCEKLASRYDLSDRERQVMYEFGQGRSSSYIAKTCYLSQNTVKTYLRRIYQKLDIHSKQELLDLISSVELG